MKITNSYHHLLIIADFCANKFVCILCVCALSNDSAVSLLQHCISLLIPSRVQKLVKPHSCTCMCEPQMEKKVFDGCSGA